MTNKKNTKRALLSAIMALLLCFAMLLGTTFAWFTDSVTSGSNIIQSGTLDVDLVDAHGASMEGQIIEFVTADDRAQSEILWEPGCTYETEPVYVVNKGSLALKYEILINGIVGNAKLLEVIEWTVTLIDENGDETEVAIEDLKGNLAAGARSKAIVLTGHMKEEAGNEYQGLTAEGISIAVFATQYTAEEDSFNGQYDATAEYAAQTMLAKVGAVAAGETATVVLESDGYVVINATNAIGAVVKGNVTLDLNGKTLFVKVEDAEAHMSLFNIVKGGQLTVTGNGAIEVLSGKNNSGVTAIFNNTAGTVVIENGTYKMDVKTYAQGSLIPTIIDNNSNLGAATAIINGGNFYHTRNMFRNFSANSGVAKIEINGGTFNGKADDWAAIWNQKPSTTVAEGQGVVAINGGEFNYVEISNEFNGGVTVADGVVVPVPVSTADELKAALVNGGTLVLTDDIDIDVTGSAFNVGKNVTATLDLNGYDITAESTSSESVELFHVEGNLTIVGEGTISLTNDDYAWNSSYRYTAIGIREVGVVTLGEGVNVVCEAGNADGNGMSYAVDIYTTGTLNVDGASLHSNYIAVRCFFGDSVVNVNSGSITSSKNNWGIWPQSAPGAVITIANGIAYTTDSYGIYIFG